MQKLNERPIILRDAWVSKKEELTPRIVNKMTIPTSYDELRDKYIRLYEENMRNKKQLNDQREKIRQYFLFFVKLT